MKGGIVLAQSTYVGETVRTTLGLTDWITLSPRQIRSGGMRGQDIEPRLIVVGGTEVYEIRNHLLTIFGQQPALYWLTGGML